MYVCKVCNVHNVDCTGSVYKIPRVFGVQSFVLFFFVFLFFQGSPTSSNFETSSHYFAGYFFSISKTRRGSQGLLKGGQRKERGREGE